MRYNQSTLAPYNKVAFLAIYIASFNILYGSGTVRVWHDIATYRYT